MALTLAPAPLVLLGPLPSPVPEALAAPVLEPLACELAELPPLEQPTNTNNAKPPAVRPPVRVMHSFVQKYRGGRNSAVRPADMPAAQQAADS